MAWFVEKIKTEISAIRTSKITSFEIRTLGRSNDGKEISIAFSIEGEKIRYGTNPFSFEGDLKHLIAAIIEMCHDPSPTVYDIKGLLKLAEKYKKTLQ